MNSLGLFLDVLFLSFEWVFVFCFLLFFSHLFGPR